MTGRVLLHKATWVVAFFWFLAMPVSAQLEEVSQLTLSPQEISRLQDVVEKPLDAGLLNTAKIKLLKEKIQAARSLGDMVNQEKFLRELLTIDNDVPSKFFLRSLLIQMGKRDEGVRFGEQLIKELTFPPLRVHAHVDLALFYLQERDLQRASELLTAAGEIIRNHFGSVSRADSRVAFVMMQSELDYFYVKSELESVQGKWSQAIETSKLAVAKSRDFAPLLNRNAVESHVFAGRQFLLKVQSGLAMRQAQAGLYSDAEWTFRELFKSSKNYQFSDFENVPHYLVLMDFLNNAGRFNETKLVARKILSGPQSLENTSDSRKIQRALSLVRTALAGLDQWGELIQALDEEDLRLANSGRTLDADPQARLRGFAYLKGQRFSQAVQVLSSELQRNLASFGETHFYTALTRGLLAQGFALTDQKALARQNFEIAVRYLTTPDSLSDDFAENAMERKTKRFILQSYMQLLAITAQSDPADAKTLFILADQISTSTVQQALTEAAVRVGVNVPGLSEVIRKEQDARNEIASLNNYMATQNSTAPEKRNPHVVTQMRLRKLELETQRKDYKGRIQKQYPEYFQLIQPKPPSPQDIAKQLQADELFVSILPMDEQTYVWAIDAKGQLAFHQAKSNEKNINERVARIRKTLDVAGYGSRAPAFNQDDAHALYKDLLAPIESLFQGKAHLIVSTSGALAQIPMGILTRKPASVTVGDEVAWLIKDVAISHVPTANGWLSLKKLGQQPSSPQAMLAWGDPVFDIAGNPANAIASGSVVRTGVALRSLDTLSRQVMGAETYVNYSKLPNLPETRDEVLELAKIMGANPAQDVILGKDATRQSVLKSSASGLLGLKKVVVFATHGLLAGDLPNLNQPALAMAGSLNPNDSPLLTLEDVLSLKLNADWVVLSACNTAGADGKAEEALSGLARGFFFAGSRSLLVTHWSVESESAMELTTHTFAAYQKDPHMRRAEALRQAMLSTMKLSHFGHPAFWAPYALVGEGGR